MCVCVCVCVCVCMVAKKNTMDYGSTCLLRQHLGYDFGDRRTFSARIWIRQIYMHPYIHTYMHTYLPTYIPTYLHTYIPTYLHTYIRTYIHPNIPSAPDTLECTWARSPYCQRRMLWSVPGPELMPDRMPDTTPNWTSEYMSDRMSE